MNFFEHGVLDKHVLNTELVARFDKTDKRPAWLRLTSISTLEDEEFRLLLEETWKDLEDHAYRFLGAILHVAGVQIWAARNGLSSRPLHEIVEVATAAIEVLEDDELFSHYRVDWADEHLEAHAGVAFFERDSAEFREITECAQRAQVAAIAARTRHKAGEALAALQTDGAEAFENAVGGRNEQRPDFERAALRAPLLSEIDPKKFAAALLDLPASALNAILGTLYRRLRAYQIKEEREWTREVAKVLKDGEGLRRFVAGRRLKHLLD